MARTPRGPGVPLHTAGPRLLSLLHRKYPRFVSPEPPQRGRRPLSPFALIAREDYRDTSVNRTLPSRPILSFARR